MIALLRLQTSVTPALFEITRRIMRARSPAPSSTWRLPSLLHASIADISEALQSKQISSSNLVKAYLERIEEAKGFNAVLQLNPDALRVAKALDEERIKSGPRR